MKPNVRRIPGFPGYCVSRQGTVWSCRKTGTSGIFYPNWHRLTSSPDTHGYLQVTLRRDGKSYRKSVHVLVMIAFAGPCPKGLEVCHRDGVKTNNRFSNLRYGTRKSNRADRDKHGTGTQGEKHGKSKLTEKRVQRIRKVVPTKKFSMTELGWLYGVHLSTVRDIVIGRLWKHILP